MQRVERHAPGMHYHVQGIYTMIRASSLIGVNRVKRAAPQKAVTVRTSSGDSRSSGGSDTPGLEILAAGARTGVGAVAV